MMTPDDDSVRTIIELPEAQIEALARFCRQERISRAEAIRRAVDKLIASGQAVEAQDHLRAAFGIWQGRHPDGRTYVEAIRGEWETEV